MNEQNINKRALHLQNTTPAKKIYVFKQYKVHVIGKEQSKIIENTITRASGKSVTAYNKLRYEIAIIRRQNQVQLPIGKAQQ